MFGDGVEGGGGSARSFGYRTDSGGGGGRAFLFVVGDEGPGMCK